MSAPARPGVPAWLMGLFAVASLSISVFSGVIGFTALRGLNGGDPEQMASVVNGLVPFFAFGLIGLGFVVSTIVRARGGSR